MNGGQFVTAVDATEVDVVFELGDDADEQEEEEEEDDDDEFDDFDSSSVDIDVLITSLDGKFWVGI